MIKNIIKKFKNKTLIKTIKKRIYIKKNIKKSNENPQKYLIGLGNIFLNYNMNLENPSTFNEKINYYKLNYENDLMQYVVDKINAKKYVENKGLKNIIIKTISTFDNINKIDWEKLPNKFVLKNTQDSGGVFVCNDKSKFSFRDAKNKLTVLNKEIYNGTHWALEKVYNDDNNKIILEEIIETEDGHAPYDYKIFCFNGEPKFLFVAKDRDTECTFDFFDTDFNWINVKQGHPNAKVRPEKPKNFDKMLEYARILSKDFPHVRVDLYNIEGKIYFGELTFYHYAGLVPFEPKEFDTKFGTYFDIESLKNN